VYTHPLKSSPVQSSPVQSSPVQSSPVRAEPVPAATVIDTDTDTDTDIDIDIDIDTHTRRPSPSLASLLADRLAGLSACVLTRPSQPLIVHDPNRLPHTTYRIPHTAYRIICQFASYAQLIGCLAAWLLAWAAALLHACLADALWLALTDQPAICTNNDPVVYQLPPTYA